MEFIPGKYAKILFNKAKSENICDIVFSELNDFEQIFIEKPIFKEFLTSLVISYKQKFTLTKGVLDRCKFSNVSSNFIILLIKNDAILLLPMILKYYNQLLMDFKKIIPAKAYIANKSNSTCINEISNILALKFNMLCNIETIIDESLMAGFIVEFDGYRIDASLKNVINKLTKI